MTDRVGPRVERLELHTETIRELTDEEAENVIGGAASYRSDTLSTTIKLTTDPTVGGVWAVSR